MEHFKICPYTGVKVPITYLPYGGDGPIPSHNIRPSGSYKDNLRTYLRTTVVAEYFRKDSWGDTPLILFPKIYPNSIDPYRMLKTPVLTQSFLEDWFICLASSAGKVIHKGTELDSYLSQLEIEVNNSLGIPLNRPLNRPTDFVTKYSINRENYAGTWELWINDASSNLGKGKFFSLIKALCKKFPNDYIPWIEIDEKNYVILAAVHGQPKFENVAKDYALRKKDLTGNNDSDSLAALVNSNYARCRERRVVCMKRTIKKYGAPEPWIGYSVYKNPKIK